MPDDPSMLQAPQQTVTQPFQRRTHFRATPSVMIPLLLLLTEQSAFVCDVPRSVLNRPRDSWQLPAPRARRQSKPEDCGGHGQLGEDPAYYGEQLRRKCTRQRNAVRLEGAARHNHPGGHRQRQPSPGATSAVALAGVITRGRRRSAEWTQTSKTRRVRHRPQQ